MNNEWEATYHFDDPERHPEVEAAMLHRYGHDEAPEEHVVGGVQIVDRNILCRHQAKEGKSNLKKNNLDYLQFSRLRNVFYFTIGIIAVTGSGRASVSQ